MGKQKWLELKNKSASNDFKQDVEDEVKKLELIILKHYSFVTGPWVVLYEHFCSFYSLFNDIAI